MRFETNFEVSFEMDVGTNFEMNVERKVVGIMRSQK